MLFADCRIEHWLRPMRALLLALSLPVLLTVLLYAAYPANLRVVLTLIEVRDRVSPSAIRVTAPHGRRAHTVIPYSIHYRVLVA